AGDRDVAARCDAVTSISAPHRMALPSSPPRYARDIGERPLFTGRRSCAAPAGSVSARAAPPLLLIGRALVLGVVGTRTVAAPPARGVLWLVHWRWAPLGQAGLAVTVCRQN